MGLLREQELIYNLGAINEVRKQTATGLFLPKVRPGFTVTFLRNTSNAAVAQGEETYRKRGLRLELVEMNGSRSDPI